MKPYRFVFAERAEEIARILRADQHGSNTMRHAKLMCERAVEYDRTQRTALAKYRVGLRPAIEKARTHLARLEALAGKIESPSLTWTLEDVRKEIDRLLKFVPRLKGAPKLGNYRSDAIFYIACLYRDYTGNAVTGYRDSEFAGLLELVLGIKDPTDAIRDFLKDYPGFGGKKSGK